MWFLAYLELFRTPSTQTSPRENIQSTLSSDLSLHGFESVLPTDDPLSHKGDWAEFVCVRCIWLCFLYFRYFRDSEQQHEIEKDIQRTHQGIVVCYVILLDFDV